MKALLIKIRQILRDRRTRRFLTRFVSGVAALVVFVTTYALVLPAITMESQAECGIEAHQHDDSCYSENLICGQEESEGHHHTEDCYKVTRQLVCHLEEHKHSPENGCFAEDGSLICALKEHTHEDSCYEEIRELICGLEESEGHHHTDSCYEKVLTCGKEVHTHSAACYKADLEIESSAVASTGMTSAAAVIEDDNSYDRSIVSEADEVHEAGDGITAGSGKNVRNDESVDADADRGSFDAGDAEADDKDADDKDANVTDTDDSADNKDRKTDNHKDTDEDEEEDASSFSTGFAADEDAENGDVYIPEKAALDFYTVLNNKTGIYYHHVAEDEDLEDSSAITDWTRADEDTELNPGDIIRVYLSYTLPKDTINATNDISRYRLPDTLHLTDDQIEVINNCENGISAQYINYDNLEITDPERHTAYLGLESVEGKRLPGEELEEDSQEYISATVKAEKIYDVETGDHEGTDLVFTFSPYTVEKNAHIYDKKGQPNRAGEKVTGWLTLDFSVGQIDWAEDNTSEIVFAEEDQENKVSEIKTVLRKADPGDSETDESSIDGAAEVAAEYTTKEAAATAANYPAAVFDDSITVRSGRLDSDLADTDIPKKTKMTVHVEADEGTFPEGTKMVLSAVEDLDAVAEAVGTAVDSKTRGFQAVDITFYDKDPSEEDAKEIEPLKPIRVSIKSDEIKKAAEDSSTVPVVVHIEDDNTATEIENTASKTDSGTIEIEKPAADQENLVDQANDSDSAGTADAVNFMGDSFSIYAIVYTVDFSYSVDGKTFEYSIEGGSEISLRSLLETLAVIKDDEYTEANEVDLFMEEVDKVEFTNDKLIKIEKLEGNQQDWILTSLAAFKTDETLTITMKNGDVFTVKVTDAQIRTYIISSKGDKYEVIVTYDVTAGIPEDAELIVKEIAENDAAYDEIKDKVDNGLKEGKENIPAHPILLDISIMQDGKVIEPAEGSDVKVEIRAASQYLKGQYTDEKSPVLVNDEPVKEEASEMEKEIQVIHFTNDDKVDVMETRDEITSEGSTSSFTTDSFSNWLVYLDEDLTDITVNTGDSLTLRPYSEWYWKADDDPYVKDGVKWVFPSNEYTTQNGYRQVKTNYWPETYENRYGIVSASTQNGKYIFEGFAKYDLENREDYWYYHISDLEEGDFDIHTSNDKVIHVHVIPSAHGDKPGTVSGISGLTVNLFDYDVPGSGNNYDFTKSNTLDEEANDGDAPYNVSVNQNHQFKFLGWGTDGANPSSGWINGYTRDVTKQDVVEGQLKAVGTDTEKYPVLNYGDHENLKYLFDPTSKNHNVYAFPNADGLFQQDNQGFYYYNSNSNYAEYDRDNNEFILYEHTYTQNTGGSGGANAKPIGFFPFHEYDTTETQPEMNFNKDLNHHFGMSMSVDFQIPKDRKATAPDGLQHDIIYEFSGDDDLWVFVDDELVLDIGGIHQPVRGTINFTTGEISVYGEDKETKSFSVGAHTLKMFYLERGGCDSNLSVRFNLSLIKGKASVDLVKKSMTDDAIAPDQFLNGAMFGVWEDAACTGEPYTTAISDSNGHIDLGYLPIKEAGQKFYIKEMAPPEGFLLSNKVYTATAVADGEDNFSFVITDGDTEVEKIPQEPFYPIIRNDRPDPISLSVMKRWVNADGTPMENPGGTATFTLKRHYYYVEGSIVPENSIIKVYRVDRDWNNARLMETREYAGDSTAYVNWTYNQYMDDSFENGEYRINNGSSLFKGNSPASVLLTAGNTINFYIRDGNLGTQWEQYGVENITVSGTEPSGSGGDISTGEGEDTSYDGPTITLPTSGGAWTDTFNNLIVREQKENRVYFYSYYVVEDAPEGFEAVYLDSQDNPISDPSSQMTNHNGSQTVVNRKLLDVPIEKHWADFIGDEYDWNATFQLQYMEVKVNENDPDAADAVDEFTNIDGRSMTISKGQTPQPSFEDLPMYKVHSNGTVYRIIYSVDETAYEVKDGHGRTVAKWTKSGGIEVGSMYAPQYEQDAGENGNSIEDYRIFVVNSLNNVVPNRGVTLDLTKTWPGNDSIRNDPDAYAAFVLKRLVHEEYRDYSDVSESTEWVDITLDTWGNGTKLQTLHVPKNTQLHIVGSVKGRTNANKIVFSQSSGQSNLELVKDNTQTDDKYLFDITFTADQTKTITLTQGDNYVVGGRDGFFLSDSFGGHTSDITDPSFEVEFTLNQANNWHEYFDYLPTIEEQAVDPTETSQTIYVYSYYLEEVGSNPAGYAASFKDSQGTLLGNKTNGIDVNTVLTAENTGDFTDIEFKKDWKNLNGNQVSKTDEVTYTLFQISKDEDGNELYHDVYLGTYRFEEDGAILTATSDAPCTFTVTQAESGTIFDLPKIGFINGKKVTNTYYVLEEHVEGYMPDSPAAVDSGDYTITNTELSPASEETNVKIKKEWEGEGAEDFGGVRFKLIQKKSELPKDSVYFSRYVFNPATIKVLNADGSVKETVIRYAKPGTTVSFRFTPKKSNPGRVRFLSTWYDRDEQFTRSTGIIGESTIILQVASGHAWGTDWDYEILPNNNFKEHAKDLIESIPEDDLTYESTGKEIYVNMPSKGVSSVDADEYSTTPTQDAWETQVNGLPYYEKENGKYYVYSYEIAEVSIIDPATYAQIEAVTPNSDGTGGVSTHFTVAYSDGPNGEKIITNTKKKTADFQIIKVDSNGMTKLLEGAKFELRKIDPTKTVISYLDDGPTYPETTGEGHKTGADGLAAFRELEEGIYEIRETETPKGYVLTDNKVFYIKVDNGVVTLVERDNEHGGWKTSAGNDTLVFAPALDENPANVKFGNTPGTELPHTGGPGPRMFTILGSVLLAFAGILLIRRRRTN